MGFSRFDRVRARNGRRAAAIAVCTGCLTAVSGAAQSAPLCPDGQITEITFDNSSVFDLSSPALGGRFAWAYRLANALHFRTQSGVLQRELLFSVGDCYDPAILRDSELLLRSFPFVADAVISAAEDADGDVRVLVETQDEWSTRIEPRLGSGAMGLRGIQLVEDNLIGTGRQLAFFYDDDEERIYGITYSTPQLFRTRWNMGTQVARTAVGHRYVEAITYPFVGETGRYAFRQTFQREERQFELLMPAADDRLTRIHLPIRREQFELGGALRWGRQRYRHTMLGAAFALERVSYPDEPVFADTTAEPGTAADALGRTWDPVSSVRFMLLTGQSNIFYVRRRGFDTLNGAEDIRLGVEAEASFGPTVPGMSDDRDIAVGLGFFAAGEPSPALLLGTRFVFAARRAYETIPELPEWNDVQAEFDAWGYYRPHPESRHLFVGAVSGVGGWHGRVPFQLTLGGDAGLRGYPRHVDPGSRRVVASFEYRARPAWPAPDLFDFGTVAFFDAGRIWAGHAPFGVDSPVRASVGLGVRAAFPPSSRQTFRIDVGAPFEGDLRLSDLTLSVGIGQVIGRRTARRDPQLLRSARYGIATSSFLFP
jgi:hypothetical protein